MDHPPIFLPADAWHRLGDFLNEHEDLARRMGIGRNMITGTITDDELLDVLGGELNIWPEWFFGPILMAAIEEQGPRRTVS